MTNVLHWDLLAQAVRAARGARTQAAIHENGGPSDTTIGKIEADEWRPRRGVEDTLRKLDDGLEWPPGTAGRILRDGVMPVMPDMNSPTDEELRLWVIELAVDADAIGSRVRPEDEGRMQNIKAVLRDSAELVGRLQLVALAVADGDANRLHGLKQQVKAGRLEEVLRQLGSQSPVVDESQVYPPPHLRVHDPDEWVEDRVPRPSQG